MTQQPSLLPNTVKDDAVANRNDTNHHGVSGASSIDDSVSSCTSPSMPTPYPVVALVQTALPTASQSAPNTTQFETTTVIPPSPPPPDHSYGSPSIGISLLSSHADELRKTQTDNHPGLLAVRGGSPGRHISPECTLRLETNVQPSIQASTFMGTSAVPIPIANSSTGRGTGIVPSTAAASASYGRPSALMLNHKSSTSSLKPHTPNFPSSLHGFGSASAASSTVPSPIISALGDVTPLPSPLLSGDSPGPWKKILGPSRSHDPPLTMAPGTSASAIVTSSGESISSAMTHQAKRKAYTELLAGKPHTPTETGAPVATNCNNNGGSGSNSLYPINYPQADLVHTRNRSLSEYLPDPMQLPKRMVTVSASHVKPIGGPDHVEAAYETHMRREPHLSEARGFTTVANPPTPPPSDSSLLFGDSAATSEGRQTVPKTVEYFEAHGRDDKKRRRWRSIKLLGQGTFSRVILATSQATPPADEDTGHAPSDRLPSANTGTSTGIGTSTSTSSNISTSDSSSPGSSSNGRIGHYDRRALVAIKVCEHGPKGGASEDRIEMSLKRELDIMRSVHHPSLIHLKAWSIEPSRAILVLSYCPGGDLFDVASTHRSLLKPHLLSRIFAELVSAVRYLHQQHIVHRDIKLENVLVNLTAPELADPSVDWATYPYSVTTLTDLGLSRRVADDEKLETRCGSDDYAAPEVIMGQHYDGRATDAWSLGVLLYALLESRLPFDPTPGMSDAHRMRSRTSHRIARVEWRWIEYAGEDGDHEGDAAKFQNEGILGAMQITEGLLKRARSRWSLEKVAKESWVVNAMHVEGGLRFRDEEEGEEVC